MTKFDQVKDSVAPSTTDATMSATMQTLQAQIHSDQRHAALWVPYPAQSPPVKANLPLTVLNAPDADPLKDLAGVRDALDLFRNNFASFDFNHNGRVDGNDEYKAGLTIKFDSNQKAVYDAAEASLFTASVSQSSRPLSLSPIEYMSQNDLNRYAQRVEDYEALRDDEKKSVPQAYEFARFATANFDKWDVNHDGVLDLKEMENALKIATTPEERDVLNRLSADWGSWDAKTFSKTWGGLIEEVVTMPNSPTKDSIDKTLYHQYIAQVQQTRVFNAASKIEPIGNYYNLKETNASIERALSQKGRP